MWAMSKAFVCFAWGLEKNLFIVCFHYPNNTNSRAGKSYERSELDLDAKPLIAGGTSAKFQLEVNFFRSPR